MEEIKKLREATGAGMVECKKALDEAAGDLDKAIEILRKKGIAKAAKRSDRQANEGVIKMKINTEQKKAYILELNSETDFVARNETFQDFAERLIEIASSNNIDNLDDLHNFSMEKGSVLENLENLSGTIGEKIVVSKLNSISGESLALYSHMNGKIGVIIALDQSDKEDLALEIAMHVAASNPKYLTRDEIPSEEIEKEKDIYKEQLLKEGKPEEIIDKIIMGKIVKYYSEVCLVDQEFIKDDKLKISDILKDTKILSFIRYSLQ